MAPSARPNFPLLLGPPPLGRLLCWLPSSWPLPSLHFHGSTDSAWPHGTLLYVFLSGSFSVQGEPGLHHKIESSLGPRLDQVFCCSAQSKGSKFQLTKYLPIHLQIASCSDKTLTCKQEDILIYLQIRRIHRSCWEARYFLDVLATLDIRSLPLTYSRFYAISQGKSVST